MRDLKREALCFFRLPQFTRRLGHRCEELTLGAGRSREYRMAQGVPGRLRGSRGTSAFRDRSAAIGRGAQFHSFRTRGADLSRYIIIVRNLLQETIIHKFKMQSFLYR